MLIFKQLNTESQSHLNTNTKTLIHRSHIEDKTAAKAPHTTTDTTEQNTSGSSSSETSEGRAAHVQLIGATTSLAWRALSHY